MNREGKRDATSVISQQFKGDNDAAGPKFDSQEKLRRGRKNGARTDQGRLHAVRDSVLSRGLLETLTRYGENRRTLRRMEAQLRTVLKPAGALGTLLFARLWSCVLRLVLVGHLEATALVPARNISNERGITPSLQEGALPVLVTAEDDQNSSAPSGTFEPLEPDILSRLALISRYDRSASREMYRTLGLLILLRDEGEKGVSSAILAAAGIKARNGEEN